MRLYERRYHEDQDRGGDADRGSVEANLVAVVEGDFLVVEADFVVVVEADR